MLDLGAQSRWLDRGLWYAQCHTVAHPADVPLDITPSVALCVLVDCT